MEAVSRKVESG